MPVKKLKKKLGGHWGEHPDHTVENWQEEVASGNTRLGYWEWVYQELQGMPKDYRVSWEIDICAASPVEAAQKAWEWMRKPDSTATVFDVVDGDENTTRVDLQNISKRLMP